MSQAIAMFLGPTYPLDVKDKVEVNFSNTFDVLVLHVDGTHNNHPETYLIILTGKLD